MKTVDIAGDPAKISRPHRHTTIMNQRSNMIVTILLVLGVPALAPSMAMSAGTGTPANKSETIAALMKGIIDGVGEECRNNRSPETLGSEAEVMDLCQNIADCAARSLKASEPLRNELYDAFTKGLPPAPQSIPASRAAIKACTDQGFAAARTKSSGK